MNLRVQKLNEQREQLLAANAKGLSEMERREGEMAAKAASRRQFEDKSQEQSMNLQRSIQETQYNAQQAWQQARVLHDSYQQPPLVSNAGEEPTAIEVESGSMAANNSSFQFPGTNAVDLPNIRGGLAGIRHDTRPRSTSAFSRNSHHAEFDDQDPAPPMPSLRPIGKLRARKASGSSGSGSGGSQRDPMSPIGAFRPSPVDKRGSPVWS